MFFAKDGEEENVNIDAILLDEPSWYVVAATETKEPEKWLAYAQDRKVADSRYSVATFRRDIIISRFNEGVDNAQGMEQPGVGLPELRNSRACPWVKLYCVRSGNPVPFLECEDCDFSKEGSEEEEGAAEKVL